MVCAVLYDGVGYNPNSSVTVFTQTQNNTFEFPVCCSVNYDLILCAGEVQSETSYLATAFLHIILEHGIH